MTALTETLGTTGSLEPKEPLATGRVVDSIRQPLEKVKVSLLDDTGVELESQLTTADGRFAFFVDVSLPAEVSLSLPGATRTVTLEKGENGDLVLLAPLRIVGSVGDTGLNQPTDVLRVQDWLHRLRRLTSEDVRSEPIRLTSGEPIDATDIPLLLGALGAHLQSATGRRALTVSPHEPAFAAPGSVPPFPTVELPCMAPVGALPGAQGAVAMNAPADVLLIQDRLRQLGLLSESDWRAERPAPGAAAPIPEARLSATIRAIRKFDMCAIGGALKAVIPGDETHRALADPPFWSYLPLNLSAPVGKEGVNLPADVRRVQDRLLDLRLLSASAYERERLPAPPRPAPGAEGSPAAPAPPEPVAEENIPETIAAIKGLCPSGRLDLDDPAVPRLCWPPRVVIAGAVGDDAWKDRVENRPAEVHALQERLVLLHLLSAPSAHAERINPAAPGRIRSDAIPLTLNALNDYVERVMGKPWFEQMPSYFGPYAIPRPLRLRGKVGEKQPNTPTDLAQVQDRLHAIRFLSDADYNRERVKPAASAPPPPTALAATFAAITRLRREVLKRPAPAGEDPLTALPLIAPGDDTHLLLNDPLRFGHAPLRLRGSVGELGWNFPEDVVAVQQHLVRWGLLSEADQEAEKLDPLRPERGSDASLPHTIAALRRFRERILEERAPVVGRLEAVHPAIAALENPLESLRSRIELSGTVGEGGDNAPDDVRAIQRRLCALRFLGIEDEQRERDGIAMAAAVPDATIPQTLIALARFGSRRLEQLDATHRRLEWPLLPSPVALGLTRRVGIRGDNFPRDVRTVQDRLHELGILSTAHYLSGRKDPSAAAPIPVAALSTTIDAIRDLQGTISGGTDRRIDPGGIGDRSLADPTHGTRTRPNPHAWNRAAGPASPARYHVNGQANTEIEHIIAAIEAHEAGESSGEVPAGLRNGSRTPASYGKAQVIGPTGIDLLNQAWANLAPHYDLTPADVATLQSINDRTGHYYNAIYNTVPAPGPGAPLLQDLIDAFMGAQLAAFHRETGLAAEDAERMFHTAFFRRCEIAFIAASPGATEEARRQAAANNAGAFMRGTAAGSIAALGLQQSDVTRYLRSSISNEHLAGFVSRACFFSEHGQIFRDFLTDDSGFKVGRRVIAGNFDRLWRTPGAQALPPLALGGINATPARQRAWICAKMHNEGPGSVAAWVANPARAAPQIINGTPNYVARVMAHWVQP